MGTATVHRQGYRSLFWPIVLIAVGVIWLLANMGLLQPANLAVLFRLWPVLLIVVGLDLLIGRQSPLMGALIGGGAVVLIVGLMLIGPSIGLTGPELEVKLDSYSEPREDAASATVQLNLSVARTTIEALADTDELFTADISHLGDLNYAVSGQSQKHISLSEDNSSVINGANFFAGLFREDSNNLYWNIGLTPDIPLALDINGGVGEGDFDLSALQLTGLSINGGVGNIRLKLPSVDSPYPVEINNGAGEVALEIAEDAALNITIKGGVGNVTIDVPDGAAVRIDANSGIGNIDVPADMRHLNGKDNDQGIWESPNFSEAARQIIVSYDGGVGNLTVR